VIQQNGNFSSNLHQNSQNFIRGRSHASELYKVGIFEIGPVFPKLSAFEILMCFNGIRPKNSWSFAVGTSTDCHSFVSEYFHSIFCSKVEGSMLNKTHKIFQW